MKTLVGIFSHPDDEAFGPSGTLAKYAKTHDVYVICATRGESGQNHQPDRNRHLAEIREEELRTSAKILGVKNVYFLDFLDGTLCNNVYHKLAEKIREHLERLKPQTIITFEMRGVSGHIDHIAVTMATTFVFQKLPFIKTLLYYCISEDHSDGMENYFIYFPPGYKRSEVDKVVDVSSVWEKKIAAIHTHTSQGLDMKNVLNRLKKTPKEEYFLVKRKKTRGAYAWRQAH